MKIKSGLIVLSLVFILSIVLVGCLEESTDIEKTFKLTVEILEGEGTIELEPDKDSYKQGTEVTVTAIADDNYEFSGWEFDLSGSENQRQIVVDSDMTVGAKFSKLETGEPIINLSATIPVLTATLSGEVIDNDGTVESVNIDWGDGNTETLNSGFDNISINHIYSSEGSYTIVVEAIDNDGKTSIKELDIRANAQPEIDVTYIIDNLTVSLGGSVTDSDGIRDVKIDWGDEESDTLNSDFDDIDISHTYTSEGNYTISIEATDNEGIVSIHTISCNLN